MLTEETRRHNFPTDDARQASLDAMLAEDMADLFDNPLEYVLYAYPWGQGELRDYDGPDKWQRSFLRELGEEIRARGFDGHTPVAPILESTVSGHGVGKSAIVAWIADFIRSTRPDSKGVVSANTGPQLETKTWAEIAKWGRRSITAHWFRITSGRGAMKIVHRKHPETWRLDGMMWQEHNAEAFAGLHAASSTPYYIFDEASKVPRVILETAQGGLTDGEPMMFLFGNGTRNSGYFYETHHRYRHRWKVHRVDSRDAKMTNKALLEQWISDYGLDSDYVKIRVRGMFPSQSAMQFISTADVEMAMLREPSSLLTDPIIVGVDVARSTGGDQSVVRIRKGRDAKTWPPIKLHTPDTMQLVGIVAKIAEEHQPDAIFVDQTGIGGPVTDRLHQLKVPNVIGINFGSTNTPKPRTYRRMDAYMWGELRDWLKNGGAINQDDGLKSELTAREYTFDADNRYVLESKDDLKERGESSPDDADALALTFAFPVGPRDPRKTARVAAGFRLHDEATGVDYDPHEEDRRL